MLEIAKIYVNYLLGSWKTAQTLNKMYIYGPKVQKSVTYVT
jgi:hypothetical protein